jgi:hypothetical protein
MKKKKRSRRKRSEFILDMGIVQGPKLDIEIQGPPGKKRKSILEY